MIVETLTHAQSHVLAEAHVNRLGRLIDAYRQLEALIDVYRQLEAGESDD